MTALQAYCASLNFDHHVKDLTKLLVYDGNDVNEEKAAPTDQCWL